MTGGFIDDAQGFARRSAVDEVGVLLGKPRSEPDVAGGRCAGYSPRAIRGCRRRNLFRRDSDGDYWLVDHRDTVIQSPRGPVFCQPICDALGDIMVIDLAVVYPVATDTHDVAVAAVTLGKGGVLTAASLTTALGGLPRDQRPAIVHIVDRIPLTPSYRPLSTALQEAGLPTPGKGPGTTTSPTVTIDNRPPPSTSQHRLAPVSRCASRRATQRPARVGSVGIAALSTSPATYFAARPIRSAWHRGWAAGFGVDASIHGFRPTWSMVSLPRFSELMP